MPMASSLTKMMLLYDVFEIFEVNIVTAANSLTYILYHTFININTTNHLLPLLLSEQIWPHGQLTES